MIFICIRIEWAVRIFCGNRLRGLVAAARSERVSTREFIKIISRILYPIGGDFFAVRFAKSLWYATRTKPCWSTTAGFRAQFKSIDQPAVGVVTKPKLLNFVVSLRAKISVTLVYTLFKHKCLCWSRTLWRNRFGREDFQFVPILRLWKGSSLLFRTKFCFNVLPTGFLTREEKLKRKRFSFRFGHRRLSCLRTGHLTV